MKTFLHSGRFEHSDDRTAVVEIGAMSYFDVMVVDQKVVGRIKSDPAQSGNHRFRPGMQLTGAHKSGPLVEVSAHISSGDFVLTANREEEMGVILANAFFQIDNFLN